MSSSLTPTMMSRRWMKFLVNLSSIKFVIDSREAGSCPNHHGAQFTRFRGGPTTFTKRESRIRTSRAEIHSPPAVFYLYIFLILAHDYSMVVIMSSFITTDLGCFGSKGRRRMMIIVGKGVWDIADITSLALQYHFEHESTESLLCVAPAIKRLGWERRELLLHRPIAAYRNTASSHHISTMVVRENKTEYLLCPFYGKASGWGFLVGEPA